MYCNGLLRNKDIYIVIVVDFDPRSINIRQSEIQNEKLCSFVVLMIFICDPTSCICVILLITLTI